MADDGRLRQEIRRRVASPIAVPRIEAVEARARVLRARRVAGAVLIAIASIAAVVLPLVALSGLGEQDMGVGTTSVTPSRTVDETPSPAPTVEAPTSLDLPPGWFQEWNPLPPLIDPVIVVAAGSWDFPRHQPLIACGPQPALEAMPPDGAFVWIYRYTIQPGEPLYHFRDAEPWPDRFRIDLPSRPGDGECAAGTEGPVRQYYFDAGDGIYLQVLVAQGPQASPQTLAQAERVLSSFRP